MKAVPSEKLRERLDILLLERELARSRTAAAVLIERGSVLVNGVIINKASRAVLVDAKIEITEPLAFVSRAGEKLDFALSNWSIPVSDTTAVDVGSSTGGFTDCLLQRGAKKVYAIDVGTDQLAPEIRSNPKVVVMEQQDVRVADIPEKVDLVVIDVSFISLSHILKKVKNFLKENGSIIALVKPQFEVGPNQVDDRGVVADESKRREVLENVKNDANKIGLTTFAEITSPITGAAGNIEYLLWLKKTIKVSTD